MARRGIARIGRAPFLWVEAASARPRLATGLGPGEELRRDSKGVLSQARRHAVTGDDEKRCVFEGVAMSRASGDEAPESPARYGPKSSTGMRP